MWTNDAMIDTQMNKPNANLITVDAAQLAGPGPVEGQVAGALAIKNLAVGVQHDGLDTKEGQRR